MPRRRRLALERVPRADPWVMRLPDIEVGMLREAVRLFLERAYVQGEAGPDVLGRVEELTAGAVDGDSIEHLLGTEGFEHLGTPGAGGERYLLRLGCDDYPHLKLAIERCSRGEEFIFTVDTHDRHFVFSENLSPRTRARFEAIQRRNSELKADVEAAWHDAGLPTFRRFIEDDLARGR